MKTPKLFKVVTHRRGRTSYSVGTIAQLTDWFGYTLECGKSYQNENGNIKINRTPEDIKSLVTNLNNAHNNSASNGNRKIIRTSKGIKSIVSNINSASNGGGENSYDVGEVTVEDIASWEEEYETEKAS